MKLASPIQAIAAAAIAVLATTAIIGLPRGADAQAGRAQFTAVAVIDISRVLQGLDERAVREQELIAQIQEREARVQDLAIQLQASRDNVEDLPQASPEQQEAVEELVILQARFRAEQEVAQAVIDNEKKQLELNFFNAIRDAAREYGQREGFDLVLTDDSRRPIDPRLPSQQVQALFGSQRVLFADEAIDITAEVITYMNNQFQAGGAGTGE